MHCTYVGEISDVHIHIRHVHTYVRMYMSVLLGSELLSDSVATGIRSKQSMSRRFQSVDLPQLV